MVRHKSQGAISNSEVIVFLRTLRSEDAFGSVTGEKRDFLRRLYEPLHDIFKVSRNSCQVNYDRVKAIKKLKIPQSLLNDFPKFIQDPLDFWERLVDGLPRYSNKTGLERTRIFLRTGVQVSDNIDKLIILRRFKAISAYKLFRKVTSESSRITSGNILKFISATGIPVPVNPGSRDKLVGDFESLIQRGQRQDNFCISIANSERDKISNEIYAVLFYDSIPDNIFGDKSSLSGENYNQAIRHLRSLQATRTANELGASHVAKELLDYHTTLIGSQSIIEQLRKSRHNKRTNNASHGRSKRPRTQPDARNEEQVAFQLPHASREARHSHNHDQPLTNTATIPPTSPLSDDVSSSISEAEHEQSSTSSYSTGVTEDHIAENSNTETSNPDSGERLQTDASQHCIPNTQAPHFSASFVHQPRGFSDHTDERHRVNSALRAPNSLTSSHMTVAELQTINSLGNGHTFEVDTDEQVAYALTTLSRGDQTDNEVSMPDHNGDNGLPENHVYQGMPTPNSHLDDARLDTFNGNLSNQTQAEGTEHLGQPHPSNYDPSIHVPVPRNVQTAVGGMGTQAGNDQHHRTHQPRTISSNASNQAYLEILVPYPPDQLSTNIRDANQRAQSISVNYDNTAGFDDGFCLPAQPISEYETVAGFEDYLPVQPLPEYDNMAGFEDYLPAQSVPEYENVAGFEDYLPAHPVPEYENVAGFEDYLPVQPGFECQPIHGETMESANLPFHGTEEVSVCS